LNPEFIALGVSRTFSDLEFFALGVSRTFYDLEFLQVGVSLALEVSPT